MKRSGLLHPQRETLLILGIVLTIFWTGRNIGGNKDYASGLIEADARGYYAWLPAIFIYGDLNFGFYERIEHGEYYNPNLVYDYRTAHNGLTINKYYAGTALCLSPFFLAGHLVTLNSGLPADGYSRYYMKSVSAAPVFYLFLSLLFLAKILRFHGIRPANRAWTLLAVVFGTNLFYYSAVEFGMSHLYSLTFLSIFTWYSLRYFSLRQSSDLVWMALSLGVVILIRPVNGIILFAIPFLAGSRESLAAGIKQFFAKPSLPCTALLVLAGLVAIQLVLYRLQTGDWIVYSYKGERFYFGRPQMIPILFSFRKGLFLYTPLYLVSLAGLAVLFRKSRFRFTSLTAFLLLVLYVLSSWQNWYYGGSFSGRVFVDYLTLFMLLLALGLQELPRMGRKVVKGLVVILVLFCQIQTYQYRHGQIHWSDMTRETYLENFLRIDRLL